MISLSGMGTDLASAQKFGAESDVLGGILGICTVGLFCGLVGLFSPVVAEH